MIKLKKVLIEAALPQNILTDILDTVKEWTESVNKLIKIKQTYNQLQKSLLASQYNLGKIKQETQIFLRQLIDIYDQTEINSSPQFKQELEKFYTLVQPGAKVSKHQIKSSLNKLSGQIVELIKNLPNKPLLNIEKNIKDELDDLNSVLNNEEIKLDTETVKQDSADLNKAIKDTLHNVIGSISKDTFEDDLQLQLNSVLQDWLKAELEKNQSLDELQSEQKKFTAKRNWQDILDKVTANKITGLPIEDQKDINKNVAEVWKLYFQEEWGPDAGFMKDTPAKVQNLGQAFIQEVLELGFEPKYNPFITFLSKTIDVLNLTASNYTIIHNCYVNDIISADDLEGKGTLKFYNLLFTKELYTLDTTIINKLLQYQAAILEFFETGHEFKNKIIRAKYQNKLLDFHTDVFYRPGEPTVPSVKREAGDAIQTGFINLGRLKNSQTIYNELSICFTDKQLASKDSNTQQEVRADTITGLLTQLKNDPTLVKEAIVYLLTNYLPTNISASEIEKILNTYNINLFFSTNLRRLPEYVQLFKKYDINDKNVIQIIKQLADKANLDKTK